MGFVGWTFPESGRRPFAAGGIEVLFSRSIEVGALTDFDRLHMGNEHRSPRADFDGTLHRVSASPRPEIPRWRVGLVKGRPVAHARGSSKRRPQDRPPQDRRPPKRPRQDRRTQCPGCCLSYVGPSTHSASFPLPVILILRSHPLPKGSLFRRLGSSATALLTSLTWPSTKQ